jgi:DNA-binding PadR family transcriptional regulator
MNHEDWAAPWPFLSRLAAMKATSRGRPGRYSGMDDFERIAALRHMHHGPPFGGPGWGRGGPFGGGPFGGGGRGRRRRGDVRTAMLILLAEEPRNGYQLMQTIEERSGGRWRPSPGSVYPTLAQLEDEGLIRGTDRDGTKLFELTDAGRERAEQYASRTAPWEEDEEADGRSIPEIASLVIQIGKAAWQVAQVGDERQVQKACETLAETRRALYGILAEDSDEDAEDTEGTA